MGHADDYVAISRLQAAYADVVSRRAFAELDHLFLPDTSVVMELPGRTRVVTGPAEFGDFVAKRIAHLEFFQFVVLNAVVELEVGADPQRASGRMHMCELRQDSAEGRFSVLYGLYQDTYTKVSDRWRFGHRRFAPLAVTHRDLDIFGYPELDT